MSMRYLIPFISWLFMVLALHAAPTASSPEGKNNQENNESESESVAGQIADVNQTDVNYRYVSPSPGRFPIIAHGARPSMKDANGKEVPYTMTQKDFDNLKDCGFNVFHLSARDDTLFNILGRLKNVEGLSVIYKTDDFKRGDSHTKGYIKGLYARMKKRNMPLSLIGGWFLKDEPKYIEINEYSQYYKTLAEADSTRMPIINLIGSPEPDYMGKDTIKINESGEDKIVTRSYEKFIDIIQDKFKPAVWSYDLYPIELRQDGSINIKYNGFYEDLVFFSYLAKKTKRPFWAYCQSMSLINQKSFTHLLPPTEEYLRFEAINALAFGAQGIVYWTYAPRANTDTETYLSALIDANGNPNKYWQYARTVNQEIRRYESVFLNADLQSYYFYGKSYYGNTTYLKYPSSSDPVQIESYSGIGLLVTYLKNNGKDYVIVVSQDPLNSQNVRVKLNETDYVITPIRTRPNQTGGTLGQSYRMFAPGQYEIYRYEKKKKKTSESADVAASE